MAKTDGDINIKTKIDTSGVEKDLKSLGSQLKSVSAGLSKSSGIGAGFAAAAVAAKECAKAIKQTSDALNTQVKAEKQLETAAKNNPYLTSEGVNNLKNYASELQKVSTVGDEQLLPFMAQLASSGRTQNEIMQIMSAALDVSASGMMSLDSAVQQLNASYSGNVGMLSRQIGELKNLTAEELKSGKAIDIVAAKFKGMAEETAKATGSFEQMKNAQGDFNEAVGKITKPTADAWNNFWKGWYLKGIEKIEALNDWLDSQTIGKRLTTSITNGLKDLNGDFKGQTKYLRDSLNAVSDDELLLIEKYLKGVKNKTAEEEKVLSKINEQKERRQNIGKIEAENARKAAERKKAEEEAAAVEKTRQDYINDYVAKLDEANKKLELEAELKGGEVTEQDRLNAMLAAYYELVKNIGEDDNFSQEKLQELKNYAAGIKEIDTSYEDLIDSINEFLGNSDNTKLSDSIEATINALKLENKSLEENSDAWKRNADKIAELEALKTEVVKKETELQKAEVLEQAQTIVSTISEYLNQFSNIVNSIVELAAQASNNQTQQELSNLSEQYNNGLVSYEEYCEKKKAISKKAAQEEYRQQLWQYHANIITATANAALAVLKAYADFGYVGGTIAGAAAALSLATVIANKPQMPAYANGGIVGGNSFTGDKIISRLNSGEMVLNQQQQAQLFKMANGYGNGGGISLNVDVVNNMGDSAKVSQQVTARGLRLTVDRIVNNSMSEGKYNNGLTSANNLLNGVSYL